MVWRPTADQMNSAAFRVIVGAPKFTVTGDPVGVIADSIGLEIKGGAMLERPGCLGNGWRAR